MRVKGLNHRIFIGLCGALHVGASRSLGQSTRPQHQCVPLPQRSRNETADSDGRAAPCGLGPFAGGVENQASGPMAASHDSRRDPWVALGALAVGDARAQYTAGLDPPQTASITSRAKVPRPLVSLHLRVQPARPGPPHTPSRPVAPPCAASTGHLPTRIVSDRGAPTPSVFPGIAASDQTRALRPSSRRRRRVEESCGTSDAVARRTTGSSTEPCCQAASARARGSRTALFSAARRRYMSGPSLSGAPARPRAAAAAPAPGSAWYAIRQNRGFL